MRAGDARSFMALKRSTYEREGGKGRRKGEEERVDGEGKERDKKREINECARGSMIEEGRAEVKLTRRGRGYKRDELWYLLVNSYCTGVLNVSLKYDERDDGTMK
jgi:hypothetical protein